jgi:hypothetical protein
MCNSDTKEEFDLGFHYTGRMMLGTVCVVLSNVPDGAPVTGKLHVQLVKLFFLGGMGKRKALGEIGFCGRETLQTLSTVSCPECVELCNCRLVCKGFLLKSREICCKKNTPYVVANPT